MAFSAAGKLHISEFYYHPLKVAAGHGWIAVLDGAPNLRVRNSRVLLFRSRDRRLVASSDIPRGGSSRRAARGHALAMDGKGRIYVAVEDSERTHLLRLTVLPRQRRLRQEWDSIRGGRYPTGIQVDRDERVTLVDGGNHRIIRLRWKGFDPQVIGSSRELSYPRGLAVDARGGVLTHSLRRGKLHLLKYASDGRLLWDVVVPGVREPLAWFYNDLLLDPQGRILLSDYARARVLLLDPRGRPLAQLKHPSFKGPMGLALDRHQRLYVADAWAKKVFVFSPVFAGKGTPGRSVKSRGAALPSFLAPPRKAPRTPPPRPGSPTTHPAARPRG